jgi:hypothetical protein
MIRNLKVFCPFTGGFHPAIGMDEFKLKYLNKMITLEGKPEDSRFTEVYFKTTDDLIYKIYPKKEKDSIKWILETKKNKWELDDSEVYRGCLKLDEHFCFENGGKTNRTIEIVCVNTQKTSISYFNLPTAEIVYKFLNTKSKCKTCGGERKVQGSTCIECMGQGVMDYSKE